MTRTLALLALLATPAHAEHGLASYYAQHGRTASGAPWRNCMCMAHRTARLGSLMRVTNERTGQSAVLLVNDRGPYPRGRIADLSPRAARAVGLSRRAGVARVVVEEVAQAPERGMR